MRYLCRLTGLATYTLCSYPHGLKYSQAIRWTRHAAGDFTDLTREEETPPLFLLALLSQLLQVKELPNRHAPTR
jgi:hypothetical protein